MKKLANLLFANNQDSNQTVNLFILTTDLILCLWIPLGPYLMCSKSKASDQAAVMYRLVRAYEYLSNPLVVCCSSFNLVKTSSMLSETV